MTTHPTPPPLPPGAQPPASPAKVGLTILMWIVWIGVIAVADFLGFMMFAFADSPGAANAAKLMIVPAFIWFGFTFVAGAILLIRKRWWTIVLAFVLAVSPPFAIFAGYNLLDGAGGRATPTAPAAPATRMTVPPGGFRPNVKTPTQPDFRAAFPRPSTRPTTAPTTQP